MSVGISTETAWQVVVLQGFQFEMKLPLRRNFDVCWFPITY